MIIIHVPISHIQHKDMMMKDIGNILFKVIFFKKKEKKVVINLNNFKYFRTGTIGIPWSILATYPGAGPQLPPSDTFRVNFFRIDTPLYQQKEYSGWSCDNTSPACFHEPLYFGYLQLQ